MTQLLAVSLQRSLFSFFAICGTEMRMMTARSLNEEDIVFFFYCDERHCRWFFFFHDYGDGSTSTRLLDKPITPQIMDRGWTSTDRKNSVVVRCLSRLHGDQRPQLIPQASPTRARGRNV
jgi:hypothetical protein